MKKNLCISLGLLITLYGIRMTVKSPSSTILKLPMRLDGKIFEVSIPRGFFFLLAVDSIVK